MKALKLGLCLALLSGTAYAQTAPTPQTPAQAQGTGGPAAPQAGSPGPSAASPSGSGAGGGGTGQASGSNDQPNTAADQLPGINQGDRGGSDQQLQGEIIQTPSGTFFVAAPGQDGAGEGSYPGAFGGNGDAQAQAQTGQQFHQGRRMVPFSRAAHFRFRGPDMDVDLKCPEEESLKACVDAATQLVDRLGTVAKR